MLNGKAVIKTISLAATLAGFGLNLVSGWASDKLLDKKIAEEVAKAVAKQN